MPSVINYVRKTDEESESISSNRARAESVQKCKHARRDREPSRILHKKASSLFSEGRVIRNNMVHCLKKLLSSFELRKCLSLAFQKYIAVRMCRPTCRPQLRRNKSSRFGDSNRRIYLTTVKPAYKNMWIKNTQAEIWLKRSIYIRTHSP